MTPFFFLTLAFASVWTLLFIAAESTRKEQLLMTLVGALCAPAVFVAVSTRYYATTLVAEQSFAFTNILFLALFFGVASVLYETLIGRRLIKHHKQRSAHVLPVYKGLGRLVIILAIAAFTTLLFMLVFSLSPFVSLSVSAIMIGLYIVADKKELRLNAVLSGAFLMGLLFIAEQLTFASLFPYTSLLIWNPSALSGVFIGAIPLEELVWAAATGFAVGPLYEYVRMQTKPTP